MITVKRLIALLLILSCAGCSIDASLTSMTKSIPDQTFTSNTEVNRLGQETVVDSSGYVIKAKLVSAGSTLEINNYKVTGSFEY